jgi:hypothetical protein
VDQKKEHQEIGAEKVDGSRGLLTTERGYQRRENRCEGGGHGQAGPDDYRK